MAHKKAHIIYQFFSICFLTISFLALAMATITGAQYPLIAAMLSLILSLQLSNKADFVQLQQFK
jgi:hypothetical protein